MESFLQTIEAVGTTVDEAVARGLEALNLIRNEVDIVVIDDGTRTQGDTRPREVRVRLTMKEHPLTIAPRADDETAAKIAAQILQELLDKMRIKGRIASRWDDYSAPDERPELRLILDIRGDDLGVLIGRQGETIDALQYLTRLIVSREMERRFNLIVDVEGYKSRRERQLRQLAERMAERVASTRRSVALEPMPPYERRIVHITLRDHPTVTTQSVGRGNSRKVTIIPKRKQGASRK